MTTTTAPATTTPAPAPLIAVPGHDGPTALRHAYCRRCHTPDDVERRGGVAYCGYRRPPGPIHPHPGPDCVVCDEAVTTAAPCPAGHPR